MITLQADFTDQPEHLPELIKRFEGGADLVVAERTLPRRRRRARAASPLDRELGDADRRAPCPASRDPFGALRLYRISLIRDLLKESRRRAGRQRRRVGGEPRAACALGSARAPHGDRGARSAIRRARRARRASDLVRRARAVPRAPAGARGEARVVNLRRTLERLAIRASLVAVPVSAQQAPDSDSARVEGSVRRRRAARVRHPVPRCRRSTRNSTSATAAWKCCRWTPCAAATRGTPSSRLRGGIPFYRVNDRYESWIDTRTLALAPLLAGHRRGQLRAEAPLRDLPRARASSSRTTKPPQESVEQSARRRLVPRISCARSRSRVGWTRTLQRLLQGRPKSGRIKVLRRETHPRAGGRVRRDRRAADHQVEGHLLRGRTRRGLAFGRRQPHHAADEVEREDSAPSTSTSNRTAQSPTTNVPLNRSSPSRTRSADARGGSLRGSHRSGRAAPEQGERARVRASARATIARSPRSSTRSPTSSSRATSAPSSTRSSHAARAQARRRRHARRPRREDRPRAAAHRSDAPRRRHAHRDERLGGDPRLRGGAFRRDVGGRRRRTTRRHVRHGRRDGPRDERRVRRGHARRARAWAKRSAARSTRAPISPTPSSRSCSTRFGSASRSPCTPRSAPRSSISIRRRTAPRSATRATAISAASPHRSVDTRRRRRRAQPRQRGDHARGVSQGAHHRAQSRRRTARRTSSTVDLDMQRHYRPRMNVVQRPTLHSGKGYEITGHHEIMVPLLAWSIVDRLSRA